MWIKCQILFGICCQFHFNFHFGLFSAHNFWEFCRYTLPLSAKGSCTWFDIVRFQGWHVRPPIEMSGCICLNSEINLSIFLYLSSCTWFDMSGSQLKCHITFLFLPNWPVRLMHMQDMKWKLSLSTDNVKTDVPAHCFKHLGKNISKFGQV